MAVDLVQVRADLAAGLIAGGLDVNVYERHDPSPELPAAVISPPANVIYHRRAKGGGVVRLVVIVRVSTAEGTAAADAVLDDLMSTIPPVLEQIADTTGIDRVTVEQATNWRQETDGADDGPVTMLAADLVTVITTT